LTAARPHGSVRYLGQRTCGTLPYLPRRGQRAVYGWPDGV